MYLGSVGAHFSPPRTGGDTQVNINNIALGIILIRRTTEVFGALWPVLAYLSISVSLNVLLTFMIVIRLVLYIRNTRTALGITGAGGLCKAVVTMLVESCALYSVSSLLVLGPMSTGTGRIANFFIPILPETQVRAFPPRPDLRIGCLM